MTDQKGKERCYCGPCVFGRRVAIVMVGVTALPFWILWSIFYGLMECLFIGDSSLFQLAKKDWTR